MWRRSVETASLLSLSLPTSTSSQTFTSPLRSAVASSFRRGCAAIAVISARCGDSTDANSSHSPEGWRFQTSSSESSAPSASAQRCATNSHSPFALSRAKSTRKLPFLSFHQVFDTSVRLSPSSPAPASRAGS